MVPEVRAGLHLSVSLSSLKLRHQAYEVPLLEYHPVKASVSLLAPASVASKSIKQLNANKNSFKNKKKHLLLLH